MLSEIVGMIDRFGVFLITSHVRLDGDALGSELALYHMLTSMGKEALIYNQDESPGNYRFLPGNDTIVHKLPALERYEVVFVLDCSEMERLGEEALKIASMKRIINIDHHVSNGNFGTISLIDPLSSSTAELLYKLVHMMNVEITKDMATNLYAAILTDTGGFRYRNTTKETLVAAGHLIERGADPQWISENIYESNPPSKVRLLTKVLGTLAFELDRRVSYMIVTRKSLEDAGALQEHTEGFVDIPRSIQGVEVSILFNELSENRFKLSLRSKGRVNVESVARMFGGGGHINAAACSMDGDIDTVKYRILSALKGLLLDQ
jgi:phosphoesterase RecJ-like protein